MEKYLFRMPAAAMNDLIKSDGADSLLFQFENTDKGVHLYVVGCDHSGMFDLKAAVALLPLGDKVD